MEEFLDIFYGLLVFVLALAVLYISSIVYLSTTHIFSTVSKVTQSLSIVVKALIRSLLLRLKLIRSTSIQELELNDLEIPLDSSTGKETVPPTLKKQKSDPQPRSSNGKFAKK